MSKANTAYVALTLPDDDCAPDEVFFLKSARRALSRLDCGSGNAPKVSTPRLRTAADTLDLRVRTTRNRTGDLRVEICARPYRDARFERDHAAQVLATLVLDMIDIAELRDIEWDDPAVHLTADDFIDLRRYVSPRRTPSQPVSSAPVPPLHSEPIRPVVTATRSSTLDCDADARRLITRFMQEVPDTDMARRVTPRPPSRKNRAVPMDADDARQVISTQTEAPATRPGPATRLGQSLRRLRGLRSAARPLKFRMATKVVSVSALFAILLSSDRLSGMLHHLTR